MPLDPSIILRGQPAQIDNPLDVQNKALSMKQLSQGIQQREQSMATDKQEQQRKIARQLAWSVPTGANVSPEQKQSAWAQMKAQGAQHGLPNNDRLPDQYPGDNFVSNMQQSLLSPEEQLNQNWRQQQLDSENKNREATNAWRQREFDQKEREIKAKGAKGENLSPGQKKVDTDFAGDYNEWTSGGAESARAEIDKLDAVAKSLETGKVTTGGATGMLPDRLTSAEVLSARADVQSTIMKSLRSLMGASFTEKEGERVIKNTYNESDTTENNLARIKRLANDLRNQANAKDAKATYYQEKGSLAGYRPATPSAPNQASAQPKVFKTNEIEWK